MTSNNKPLVVLACLCEKVLRESDGVISVIRVVDQFYVANAPAVVVDMERLNAQLLLTVVLGLKSNGNVGQHEVSIQLVGGTKSEEPQKIAVEFTEDPLSSTNLVFQVAVGVVKNFGEKRFDIFFDGESLTSIPFRVLPAPVPEPESTVPSE